MAVALNIPGLKFTGQLTWGADPSVQALARQDAQCDLRYIQPTAMAGRVMNVQTAGQPMGFGGREGCIERCNGVCVEIVAHQLHTFGVRIIMIQQRSHLFGPVHAHPTIAGGDPPPTTVRVKEYEDGLNAAPLVVIVFPKRLASTHGQGFAIMTQELFGSLVHAD